MNALYTTASITTVRTMSDVEDMMIHSAGMVNTSVIIFFIALVFLPWYAGLYNPEIDIFGGKMMIESMAIIGSALLLAGATFTFLVGTGWLVISTVFYGFEKVFFYNEHEGENNDH